MMTSLPEGYRALVVGATGAIGGALLPRRDRFIWCWTPRGP
jgi:hypothetical protein